MFKKLFKTEFDDNINDNLDRTNFVRNRIKIVEKYFPDLGKAFYEYIDKSAKSRDCTDKIAVILNNYGKAEKVISSVKLQMQDLSNILFDTGTERDKQIQALETEVLGELNECNKLCALVQMELKMSLIAREKERKLLRQLERAKKHQPQDFQKMSLSETAVLRARGESVRATKNLSEQIDIFERRRLHALKEILQSWTLAELQFHSRALQLFTNAYKLAADMDVNSVIQEFRNKLKSVKDTDQSSSGIGINSIFHHLPPPF